VVLKIKAPICNLKTFTLQGKKSWYVDSWYVVLKKLAPMSNLKMFTVEGKKSWYVEKERNSRKSVTKLGTFCMLRTRSSYFVTISSKCATIFLQKITSTTQVTQKITSATQD